MLVVTAFTIHDTPLSRPNSEEQVITTGRVSDQSLVYLQQRRVQDRLRDVPLVTRRLWCSISRASILITIIIIIITILYRPTAQRLPVW